LDDIKLFYFGIVNDIIEKIEDAYTIDKTGMQIGLLPFIEEHEHMLTEYNLMQELKMMFKG
jgi:hypothetical protein